MREFFFAILGDLITPLIVSAVGFIVALLLSVSFESKLIICNIALGLSIVILILNLRFPSRRIGVIKMFGQQEVYLTEGNGARHIPDPKTLDYLGRIHGLSWGDIQEITPDEFRKRFTRGSMLPSIHPYCEAFYEEKIKQNLTKES